MKQSLRSASNLDKKWEKLKMPKKDIKFEAKNKMGARKLFRRRKLYDAFSHNEINPFDADGNWVDPSTPRFTPVNTYNFWRQERLLYGRIDTMVNYEVVEPVRRHLSSVPFSGGSIRALNFVAIAFGKFSKEYAARMKQGYLDSSAPFLADVKPKKGYVNARKEHADLQKRISDLYVKSLRKRKKDIDILSIDDFIDGFMDFYLRSISLPLTREYWMSSKYVGTLSSGLAVEVAEEKYGSDEEKGEFINSVNYQGFKNLAIKHGFLIDKNIPWRLVADLSSEKMIGYAQEVSSIVETTEHIFSYFYAKPAYYDMSLLKTFILKSYNSFVKDNQNSVQVTRNDGCVTRRTTSRHAMSTSDFESKYSNDYWLEKYIIIRNHETGINHSPQSLAQIIEIARDMRNSFDMGRALSYIKYKFSRRTFVTKEGSHNYRMEQIKQADAGNSTASVKEIVTERYKKNTKKFF